LAKLDWVKRYIRCEQNVFERGTVLSVLPAVFVEGQLVLAFLRGVERESLLDL